MKKLLILKMMIIRQIFSFLKNVLVFLIERLYKEGEYMRGRGRSNYSEEASKRGGLFAKQLGENKINDRRGKYGAYELDGEFEFSYRAASVVFGKPRLTGFNFLQQTNICPLLEGNRLFINIKFGGPLTYQRQIDFKLGNFVQKVAILVFLNDIKIFADFSVEKETGKNGFLLNFAVNEFSGFKLRVNGFGYFDWTINLFLSFWRLILGRIFRNLLEKELEQYILNRLPNHQFPLEGTSYRKETKFNNEDERVQNNEASELLSESFDTKHSPELPNWPMSPIGKSSAYDGHNLEEYLAEKDLESNLEITSTANYFPETNKWISQRNSLDLPFKNKDLGSETLNKISHKEIPKDKAADKCDPVSELSRKTRELTRSYEMMVEKLDILDKDDKENTNSASSSPSKRLGNEETRGNEEKDSYKNQYEIASEVANENHGESELLEAIFPEIQEPSNKMVNRNAFNMGIKSPSQVAKCDSSLSKKLKSSQIHENILEPSCTETGIFANITPDFDSKRRKVQISHLENRFNGKKRKERTEDSNENRVSVESFNHCQSLEGNFSSQNPDLKLCSTKMFQNESLISCTVGELEKHLQVLSNVSSRKIECQIDDSESAKNYETKNLCRNRDVKSSETQCICNPEDEVDGRNLSRSNIVSDSMQQKAIQDEKSFDLEVDTEKVSTLQFNENELNEKVPLECVKIHTEEELKKGSQLKENEGCSVVDSNNSKQSCSSQLHPIVANFPTFPINPAGCEAFTEAELVWEIYPFSVNSFKTTDISMSSKQGERSDSTNHITNSQSEECSLVEERACLDERDTECTDSVDEISNATGLKLNENSNKRRLEEATDLKSLRDLQEEINAETRKMLSDVSLKSDPEGDVYSRGTNLEYLKSESIDNELNLVQQKDSKEDVGVVPPLEDIAALLAIKEYCSTRKNVDLEDYVYVSDSDTETSESENEPKHEM